MEYTYMDTFPEAVHILYVIVLVFVRFKRVRQGIYWQKKNRPNFDRPIIINFNLS